MVYNRLPFTRVNRLCDAEDTDLRQERLSKVKQVSQDYFGSSVSWEKEKYLDLKRFGPEVIHKISRSSY